MILLFGGNKCSGKSTTIANCAVVFSKNYKTVLVDTDKQLSLTKWNERRKKSKLNIKHDIVSISDENIVAEQLINLNENYELVMVDVAGMNSKALIQSLAVADITIVSLESSIKALETLDELNIQYKAIKKINPNNSYVFLQVRTKIDFALQNKRSRFLDFCKNFSFGKVLNTIVYEKDSFVNSDFYGGTVFDTKDIKAQENIKMLCKEITNIE